MILLSILEFVAHYLLLFSFLLADLQRHKVDLLLDLLHSSDFLLDFFHLLRVFLLDVETIDYPVL